MKHWNVQRYNDEDLYELIIGSGTLCEDIPVPVMDWQSLAAEAPPAREALRDTHKLKPIKL